MKKCWNCGKEDKDGFCWDCAEKMAGTTTEEMEKMFLEKKGKMAI